MIWNTPDHTPDHKEDTLYMIHTIVLLEQWFLVHIDVYVACNYHFCKIPFQLWSST